MTGLRYGGHVTKPTAPEGQNGDQEEMPAATAEKPTEMADPVVQFGGRIPASLRRRVRLYAAETDKEVAEILREALTEYLTKRDH